MQNDTMNMISDPFTNCIIPFLLSKASILAKSGFNLATFIEEVRAVMGVPDWFLYLDSRRTRRVHSNKCVQIRIHFAGPQANRLEQDFNTLLRTGKLPQPSIYIPGKKNIQNLMPVSLYAKFKHLFFQATSPRSIARPPSVIASAARRRTGPGPSPPASSGTSTRPSPRESEWGPERERTLPCSPSSSPPSPYSDGSDDSTVQK